VTSDHQSLPWRQHVSWVTRCCRRAVRTAQHSDAWNVLTKSCLAVTFCCYSPVMCLHSLAIAREGCIWRSWINCMNYLASNELRMSVRQSKRDWRGNFSVVRYRHIPEGAEARWNIGELRLAPYSYFFTNTSIYSIYHFKKFCVRVISVFLFLRTTAVTLPFPFATLLTIQIF
jgi:hypothetical protein